MTCLRLSVYKARRVAKQTSHLPCKCALVTDNGTALCTQLASQKHGVIVVGCLLCCLPCHSLAACRRSLYCLGSKAGFKRVPDLAVIADTLLRVDQFQYASCVDGVPLYEGVNFTRQPPTGRGSHRCSLQRTST